jgi:hypothetical protein
MVVTAARLQLGQARCCCCCFCPLNPPVAHQWVWVAMQECSACNPDADVHKALEYQVQ